LSEKPDIDSSNDETDDAPSRPPPRNPFAESKPLSDDEALPPLIDNRRTAAITGVVVGLIMLILVVALCVTASYAFS
jgi:hypothetical protein